jgi:hypothetical protein
MSDDLQNNSFDELLSAALEDYVDDQPRPALDRRILANLPARRPMRWALWPALITVSALALAIVSLHLHREALITAGVPHDHGTPSVASADVIVGTLSSSHLRANLKTRGAAIPLTATPVADIAPSARESQPSPNEATSRPEAKPWRDPGISPPQLLPTTAETETSTQMPAPTIAANGEIKIEPIHIAPLDIPPLPTAEAATQPIPPIKVEPIKIAPIQISSLEVDRPDSNQ